MSVNVCRMISICHDLAYHLLRETIIPALSSIIGALLECPEMTVRSALADILCHLIIVAINSRDIDISETERKGDHMEWNENLGEEDTIKFVIRKLLLILKTDKKDMTYKKLKGFFRIWLSLAKGSSGLCVWLLKKHKLIDRLLCMRRLPRLLHGETS